MSGTNDRTSQTTAPVLCRLGWHRWVRWVKTVTTVESLWGISGIIKRREREYYRQCARCQERSNA